MSEDILHYGVKRRSGRYPWGSGEKPQRSFDLISKVDQLRSEGHGDTEIASRLGMTTTQFRSEITIANKVRKEYLMDSAISMREDGKTYTEIGERLGISPNSAKNYIRQKDIIKETQLDNIVNVLKESVKNGEYIDVGVGTEIDMGISRQKLKAALHQLQEEGYQLHDVYLSRLQDPTKNISIKVLTKEKDIMEIVKNSEKIKPVEYGTEDGGLTMHKPLKPKSVDWDRVHIQYGDQGGEDKDGVIELRKGVKDLDMGNSKYAQVRIAVGGTHYLKGMAVYADDLPKGTDIRFNTNKKTGTPKESVLKELKKDKDNIFGATIKPNGQRGSLNIVNEEGDWNKWKSTLSAQFLSKQPLALVKDRLDATYKNVTKQLNEINSLTNPIVKKHMLQQFSDELGSKMSHLKTLGLPNTKGHVILPFPNMKPNEVYAPNYNNGDRVVLVRYPHGGTFELPELTVNNKGPAKSVIKNATDALGIHPSVAKKLSGADFDGDTVYVIPNNLGRVKTTKSLKALENFDPIQYKVDHKTMTPRQKQQQMGYVSNLITDMTIKGASTSELARAVKHSMVVIDAEKHNLDWRKSADENAIGALYSRYQTRVSPLSKTGKPTKGAATFISVKKKIDVVETNPKTGKSKLVKKSIYDYVSPEKLSSGTAVENAYVGYVKKLQILQSQTNKDIATIKNIQRNPEASKKYANEVISLNKKLNIALANAPKERRAQILANKYYYKNLDYEMDKDQKKKLKSQSVARARVVAKASKKVIKITDKEWEAIQSGAISNDKLEKILRNSNMDDVKKLATPKQSKAMSSAKVSRARAMLSNGKTYAEVAKALGVSPSTIREALE